jgi:hypothetical protein
MRDDHDGASNGRPGPRVNGVPQQGGAFARVLTPGDDADAPIDLVAVQADDELVNAVGVRTDIPARARPETGGRDAGPLGTDDRLVAMLAAWRAEIDAEPIPELIDLDNAVAAVLAGVQAQDLAARRKRAGRLRHLAPLAAAAAIIVATVTGVGLGSQNAMPGDTLWPIQKVVNPERAGSVEAKVSVESHLENVRAALAKGDTVTAAQELEAIRTDIPAVRGQEGQPQLVQEQEFLAAKLADTPPGTPADLSTPARSNPAARPTGAPSTPPVPAVPSVDSAVTGPSASDAPTAPGSTEPDVLDRPVNPAIVPEAPEGPRGGEPAVPPADPSEPQVTKAPEVTAPEPNPAKKPEPSSPGNNEGGQDGTTAPGPVHGPPASGGEGGAAPGADAGSPSTSDTATASGSAGASAQATATDSTTS